MHAFKTREQAAKEFFERKKHQQLAPEDFLTKEQLERVHRAIRFTQMFNQIEANKIAEQ